MTTALFLILSEFHKGEARFSQRSSLFLFCDVIGSNIQIVTRLKLFGDPNRQTHQPTLIVTLSYKLNSIEDFKTLAKSDYILNWTFQC